MIRMTPRRSVCATTNRRPCAEIPNVTRRSSSREWSGSWPVTPRSSRRAVVASSNETPCFRRFVLAFLWSHSKRMPHYRRMTIGTPYEPAASGASPQRTPRRSRSTEVVEHLLGRQRHRGDSSEQYPALTPLRSGPASRPPMPSRRASVGWGERPRTPTFRARWTPHPSPSGQDGCGSVVRGPGPFSS